MYGRSGLLGVSGDISEAEKWLFIPQLAQDLPEERATFFRDSPAHKKRGQAESDLGQICS